MVINYNKLISVQHQHTLTDTCTHMNIVDHVVTSRAVNMELLSVCMAQGHLTAPNKTLINTRPLKAPADSMFVCVCLCLSHGLEVQIDTDEGRQVSVWSSAMNQISELDAAHTKGCMMLMADVV